MDKYLLATFCIFITGMFPAYGQDDGFINYGGFKEIGMSSPTASGLGKYGRIPVDLSSGVPEIRIPLAEVGVGNLRQQVSLSYHAGGIKVSEYPGEVGLGWSLAAGGVITRVMRGFPDEHAKGYFSQLAEIDTFFSTPLDGDSKQYLVDLAKNKFDGDADLYFYNFAGKSGLLAIDGTGHFVSFPHVNLQVSYSQSVDDITSFTITDEDGTTYSFAYTEQTEKIVTNDETPRNLLANSDDPYYGSYNSAWYLSKATSPEQDQFITFSYESLSNSATIRTTDSSFLMHKIGNNDTACPDAVSISTGYSESRTVSHARLTTIEVSGTSGIF